jgi:tetratricopeptide (TPR) repeat protein
MKPTIRKYTENEWEFIFPAEIDNEAIYNKYSEALELLDYDDLAAEKKFKALIDKFPFYIDAYNHLSLAFKNQNKRFESYITAEKSYQLGKQCFPKQFKIKKDKLIWSNLNNRPFLRSCQIFGLECQDRGEYENAIKLYDENLSLNENDNQGIRFLKLECLLAAKEYATAGELLKKYADDWSIEFTYGKVVLEIINGNDTNAKKYLAAALKANSFLPSEIIKEKHKAPPPHRIPGEPFYDAGIPVGSIQEAYGYWSRNKPLYKMKKIVDFFKNIEVAHV